jgi:predicted alpha/beta hydrolase family esterase
VAPADPDKFGLTEVLRVRSLAAPSLVVGSLSDPWMTSERAHMWAGIWGADFLSAGDLGHINAESGIGDWPLGLSLLGKIVTEAKSIFHNHIRT